MQPLLLLLLVFPVSVCFFPALVVGQFGIHLCLRISKLNLFGTSKLAFETRELRSLEDGGFICRPCIFWSDF